MLSPSMPLIFKKMSCAICYSWLVEVEVAVEVEVEVD
jgi:hypothetical protein